MDKLCWPSKSQKRPTIKVNEKEQAEQVKIQNVQFETKKNFQEIELNPQGDKKFKEKADPGWIKGLVTSGQDSTQLSFQLVKRNS